MTTTYNLYIVFLSLLMAMFASFTVLGLGDRIASADSPHRKYWLLGDAMAMGIGIWAMHFIGMLAFYLPIPLGYDTTLTSLSVVPAILASAIALYILRRPEPMPGAINIASVFMGCGIAAMHYTGMAALRMSPPIHYDPELFTLSIIIAVAASWGALKLSVEVRKNTPHPVLKKLGAALVMGLAIAGMHYTGMAAAGFDPRSMCLAATTGLSTRALIVLTSTSGFIVLLLASLAVYFTERQRMGEALRQSEERLREAVRASQTGIFDHDHVTGTIYWSPEHRRIYGWDADEPVTTQKFMEHVLAEDREKVLESIRRTFDPVGDGQNDMEFRIIDRNGKTRWLSTRSHTYYEGEGGERRLLRTVDAVADITEHKQTEDALRDLNENLERLVAERTEELAKARDTAEHANLAKSDFLSRMSHELRTPLHSILGFSQMLEDHVSQTEEEKQIAQQIWNSGRHLLMLIDEVLDIARIEAGKLELFLEDVDLSDILAECLHLVQGLADKKYVVIHQKEDEGLAVHTDRLRLKQILLNLLSNAIKYNQQGGSITVNGVAQPNGYVRVTVTDTGKGIPEDQQGLVFQPFTRIHPKDRATAGTGIGLTISQKLVEEMGGKMGFESRPGVGSTFWFELPASDYHRIKDAALPTAATAQVIATPATTEATGKVLYIEDTPTNVQLMRLIIKRLPGVELLDTDTAEQGIVLAKEVHPALILMDINLPGMDGIEALQVLRRDETTRDIPVIAVSAAAMPHDLERIQQAGFDNHLGKPFNIQEVPALLTKHLTASKDI